MGKILFHTVFLQSGTRVIFTMSSKCPNWKDVGKISRVMFNFRLVTQYTQITASPDILYSWYSEKKLGVHQVKAY